MKKTLFQKIQSNMCAFIIGGIVFSAVGASAATLYQASQISYNDGNVETSLNELYDTQVNKISEIEEKIDNLSNKASFESYDGADYFGYAIGGNSVTISRDAKKRLFEMTASNIVNDATFLEYDKSVGLTIKDSGFYYIYMLSNGNQGQAYGIVSVNGTALYTVAFYNGSSSDAGAITIYLEEGDIVDPYFQVYNANVTVSWSSFQIRKLTK